MNRTNLCDTRLHFSRRTLLGGGGASLMMTPLATALARAAQSPTADRSRPKSVILLWMEGGNSQLETFDPHAGTKYGGDVKAIDTSVKGVHIADLMPQTAQVMHLASLVRSVVSKEGEHERAVYQIKSGFRPDPTLIHPSIGAVICHADPQASDLPRHISILPGRQPARGGYLGAQYDAFKIDDPAGPVPDVASRVDQDRSRRRLSDLSDVVEREFSRGRLRQLEIDRTLHRDRTDAALRMMSSDQLAAFDVSEEPRAVRDAFGDTPFGRGCLAASRLVEVGARCVEVTLGGWDSHVTNHLLHVSACGTLDPALAALLTRLHDRGLLETTMVLCAGEFGRTPVINAAEGRDHWPNGFSILVAGGGFRGGYVHGGTAAEPKLDSKQPHADVRDPVTIADLHATIYHALGLEVAIELPTPIGRPMKRSEGTVVDRLLV